MPNLDTKKLDFNELLEENMKLRLKEFEQEIRKEKEAHEKREERERKARERQEERERKAEEKKQEREQRMPSLIPKPLDSHLKKTTSGASSQSKKSQGSKKHEVVYEVDPEDILPNYKFTEPVRDNECIKRSKLPLRNIQVHGVNYINNHKSLLVLLDTGKGKTLLAVAAAECFLDEDPKHEIILITKKSLGGNFQKNINSYGSERKDRYKFFSFQKYMIDFKNKKNYNCKNAMLIIDEAHNLRNYEGIGFDAVMDCAMVAKKVLLLTATPFVNEICDFIPLINLVHQKYIISPQSLPLSIQDRGISKAKTIKYYIPGCGRASLFNFKEKLHIISKLLQGRVLYDEGKEGVFPSKEIHKVLLPMDPKYEEAFLIAIRPLIGNFTDPHNFANGYRRAVNSIGSDKYMSAKIQECLRIIESDDSQYAKNVVFTNWLQYGVDILEKVLKENNISFRTLSGRVSAQDRTTMVEDFNLGAFNTLIITNAALEGIDLKGVQQLIILDPVWNNASTKQILGRAIDRDGSHTNLPEDRRKVNAYFLQLAEKAYIDGTQKESYSGDVILYESIKRKTEVEIPINKMLRDISIA